MIKKIPILLFFLLTAFANGQELKQRLYLVGDGGELENGLHPISSLIEQIMEEEDEQVRSELIILGDNIYPKGMPIIGDEARLESENILKAQVWPAQFVEGQVWLIPGNHDWKKGKDGGWEAILRSQAFIDSLHIKNLNWVPKDACPGPYVSNFNEEALLVFIDSQWWLHSNEKPGIDSDCECKSEEELLERIRDIFENNREKMIMLVMHHPLKTFGEHNGAFSWKDHIFPLTSANPDLYVPLPIIGSIYPLYRTFLGNIQDVPHPKYQTLINGLEEILVQHPSSLVISGHEHALEYTIDQRVQYIVSGAGSKSSRIKRKNPAEFTYENQGFSTLDFFQDGKVKLNFYSLENGTSPIYEKVIFQHHDEEEKAFSKGPREFPDSVEVAASKKYHASASQEKLYGENYRAEWGQIVRFRTFDLKKEKGGMKILKKGGGMQTRSLRLEDKNKDEFVLRSIEKYPESAIPQSLRNTIAKDIVQDQISASHPYGALIIPTLADAVGVFHTNPELVWLPDDPALGSYQERFGGAVYLYEGREISPQELEDEDYKFYSTDKMLRKRFEDQDFELNQKYILRARILDLLIGDWDRHDDQWRWIGLVKKKGREFLPMPRDRDQAFFVNEGLFPKIASRKWIMPKFQGFGYELRDVNGYMFNARYFDRSFLNDLDKEDWEDELDVFVDQMDDDVIERAVKELPKEIYQHHGEEIIAKLKHRKTWLKEEALKYYEFLSKKVDVYGTYKSELIEIRHEPDGKVDVELSKISKKGDIKQKIFNRKFDPWETKEVRVYGMGGKDEISITGEGPGKIKVRVLSGLEEDKIVDESKLGKKANWIYHWKKQDDDMKLGKSSKVIQSKESSIYDFDRKAFKYDLLMPLASLEYNVDDGIFIGGGVQWTKHGFRKEPYAIQQEIKGNIAIKTGASNIYYQGHAVDMFGTLDLEWDASFNAPNNVNNFFGYGNESSEFLKDEFEPSYYRARYNQIKLNTWIRKDYNENIHLKLGPLFQRGKMDEDDNIGKFIYSSGQTDIDIEKLNEEKLFSGGNAQLVIDHTDHPKLPQRGVKFLHSFSYYQGLNDYSEDLASWISELSLYWSRQIPSRVTWATRFGGGVNWGDYEFFQAQVLGGQNNLRGYRRNRYMGDAMIYNNTEARIQLNRITTRLFPATIGLTLFHDIGRVWLEGENSNKWHNSYGVGIWLAPMNMMVLTGTISIGEEEVLPTFTFGFQF
ncbi:BamA/TamA family outer membrane protein [Echinicola jeungdonensis]|uniref:BamA/TamA family outer membrane protein n=1 Tax=Echinicola jeungdonensis TaxID=709343 RepID=A0ABV5J753_9BACT|nr:BamA/TamA family outer membrane protein [Echinicola jeungdonensis]MDN3668869.1 BamA/TamA family outer membrane protein [Echinicola jeungdonensis]